MKEINMKNAIKLYREQQKAVEFWRYAVNNPRFRSEREQEQRNKTKMEAISAYASETGENSKLALVLSDVQQRSKVRTIDVNAVVETLVEIEDTLEISKKAMEGITVHVDRNAQSFPSAYKYTPESTHFWAIYKNGSWRITNVRRDRVMPESRRVVITHTDASKAALLDRFSSWG